MGSYIFCQKDINMFDNKMLCHNCWKIKLKTAYSVYIFHKIGKVLHSKRLSHRDLGGKIKIVELVDFDLMGTHTE